MNKLLFLTVIAFVSPALTKAQYFSTYETNPNKAYPFKVDESREGADSILVSVGCRLVDKDTAKHTETWHDGKLVILTEYDSVKNDTLVRFTVGQQFEESSQASSHFQMVTSRFDLAGQSYKGTPTTKMYYIKSGTVPFLASVQLKGRLVVVMWVVFDRVKKKS